MLKFRSRYKIVGENKNRYRGYRTEDFECHSWTEALVEAIRFADHEWVLVAIELIK